MRLVLASASPRRLELLRALGLEPEVVPAAVDESVGPDEAPRAAVLRLARAKAKEVAGRVEGEGLVLGADTVVALGTCILGKPEDTAAARRMIVALSGKSHEVHTGVVLVACPGGRESVIGRAQPWRTESGPAQRSDSRTLVEIANPYVIFQFCEDRRRQRA